jgi:hypothetical protein
MTTEAMYMKRVHETRTGLRNESELSSTMAGTSTLGASQRWHLFGIEEVFPPLRWVIISRDEIAYDSEVRELSAPSSPLANCTQRPTPAGCEVLTSTTAKGVCSVRQWVYADVQEVVAK